MNREYWSIIDLHYHIGINELCTFDAEKEMILGIINPKFMDLTGNLAERLGISKLIDR